MIFLDIETLPTNDNGLIDELGDSIRHPGNITKKASIQEWMDNNYKIKLDELIAKTSLDGLYGRIACIAWSKDDYPVQSTPASATEEECLQIFFDYLERNFTLEDALCGHNIAGFDLPFIKHRSMVLGISPPTLLKYAFQVKPWDSIISDTMLMWSADKSRMVSMKKLCKVFGIEYADDFDGSMVAEAWKNDPQKVIDYCCNDVRRTREIYNRLTWS